MIEFLNTLVLLGSLQGIIMSAVLWLSVPRLYASRLLAVIIFLAALPGIHYFLHYRQFFGQGPCSDLVHAVIPWVSVMALGPMIHFYVRAVIDPTFRIKGKWAWWCLPIIIDLFPKMTELAFLSGIVPHGLLANRGEMVRFIDQYNVYADLPRWISLAGYTLYSRVYLARYRASKIPAISNQQLIIHWLNKFLNLFTAFVALWLIFLVPYLLPGTSTQLLKTMGWFPVYLPMAFMIYWLGLKSHRNGLHKKAVPIRQLQDVAARLISMMESDRLFLDPALDLSRFATRSGIPAKQVSASLNQALGKSFNQFVNEYRIAEFNLIASDPMMKTFTIAGMAAKCGFASAATFQRAFRQVTGSSPTEYKRRKAS